MRKLFLGKMPWIVLLLSIFLSCTHAAPVKMQGEITIDRIQLVNQQIDLLKSRLAQSNQEFKQLEQQQDKLVTGIVPDKTSKRFLDKAGLDISVAQSNLDSINIEFSDTRQTLAWLEKSIQEIENQLNVLNIFGLRHAETQMLNPKELQADITYQRQLSGLEKQRLDYLQQLQTVAGNILSLRKEMYDGINAVLQSRNLLHAKQEQVQDELSFQRQQNYWLQQLTYSYDQLGKLDPAKSPERYAALERDIYYANEYANYAYLQSLLARYSDQIHQMRMAVMKNNSISILNEIADQNQALNKQVDKLSDVLKTRIDILEKHVNYLTVRKKNVIIFQPYIGKLTEIIHKYKVSEKNLDAIRKNLSEFRGMLDKALQTELSARQGFPALGLKTLVDLGKEMILIPDLTFQIAKSLSNSVLKGMQATSVVAWGLLAVAELLLVFTFFFMQKLTQHLINLPSRWRDKINSQWLILQWLQRNYLDLFVIVNLVAFMTFFDIAHRHYLVILYLSLVWMVFKGINIIARLCLVETTHDTAGSDVRLYHRLKWIILIGGVITAFTVFVHQLPMIYELKNLCDRIFLVLMMIVSLMLLRSSEVVPSVILAHTESNHPYLRKSIHLMGILVPLLMFGNSVIGVFGYLNLIMTVSWYEGVFLIVLTGYLILRGLLTDSMEQISRLLIQYVNNGWLWTEAFLKPVDKILRITLFLLAWTVLFILYGWDKQSPIVEQLNQLLHYKLLNFLNTSITPLSMIELGVVISIFYWTAKWIREFVYRMMLSRTNDMGIRNSIAILSQYTVIGLGVFFALRVLGIQLQSLVYVSSAFAFGIGLGLRDLANNFASGFLILLERPLRVGDIVNINGNEGEVTHIGSRAVTIQTWDHMELVVPNAEIFNKSFTNWTAKDNTVRSVVLIKISRHDNPHEVKVIVQNVLGEHPDILADPAPEVYLKNMNDVLMEFEIRYFVNIRQVKSRTGVISSVLMKVWDAFALHGIKPPYPQQEIMLLTDNKTSTQKVIADLVPAEISTRFD